MFSRSRMQLEAFLRGKRRRGDLETLYFCILFDSLQLYMEVLVNTSSFHVWKSPSVLELLRLCSLQTICLLSGFFSHFLCLFRSISLWQNFGDRESKSVASSLWICSSIFHMHYETQLIKLQVWLWLVRLQYDNCLFFLCFLIFCLCFCLLGAGVGGCRLDKSTFMPVFKALGVFIYRWQVDSHLHNVFGRFIKPSLSFLTVSLELWYMLFVGVTYLSVDLVCVFIAPLLPPSYYHAYGQLTCHSIYNSVLSIKDGQH